MIRRKSPRTPKRTLQRIISDSFRAGFAALDDRPNPERGPSAHDPAEGPAAHGGEIEIPAAEAMRA